MNKEEVVKINDFCGLKSFYIDDGSKAFLVVRMIELVKFVSTLVGEGECQYDEPVLTRIKIGVCECSDCMKHRNWIAKRKIQRAWDESIISSSTKRMIDDWLDKEEF